jgi:pimeloyl-ACP methyl ester carboxylesterase
MERIVYIIPGFGESHARQKSYRKVAALFAKAGFTVVHVNIDWHHQTPREFGDYQKQFLSQFKKKRGAKTYVLGFSYGATIAFLTANKTKPAALVLCSLSPYFTEDQKNIEPEWLVFWKKRFAHSDYSFAKLAPTRHSSVRLVVGDSEHHSTITRARDAKRRLPNATLTIAKGAKHDIGQKEYLATLEKVIAKL